MIRTSETHPLHIAAVDLGVGKGKIGVTLAPGKHDSAAEGGAWARDLQRDLDVVAAWKPRTVVTLIEPHEFEWLNILTLGDEIRHRGMDWLHLPIRDVSVPDAKFEAAWPAHSIKLRAQLDAGKNILIHCRGGLGRAGMIAARLLVETGVKPETAMARVRVARPGAIETPAQEDWVRTGPGSGSNARVPARKGAAGR
jgi:predicted protein tyrosine phosphatase